MEQAARDALAALPSANVRLGCEMLSLEERADGVVATLLEDGRQAQVSAAYVVGCDGGRSAVRAHLGTGMRDMGFEENWMVVDVKLPPEVGNFTRTSRQLCDPERPTTSAVSGPGRHRWEFMIRNGESAEDINRPEVIREWLKPWLEPEGIAVDAVELETHRRL